MNINDKIDHLAQQERLVRLEQREAQEKGQSVLHLIFKAKDLRLRRMALQRQREAENQRFFKTWKGGFRNE